MYDSKLQNGGYWSDVVLEKKCRNINTTLLTKEEDVYWRAYPVYGGNTPNKDDKAKNADISQRLKDFEIKQFRIINIEDRSYWCFDVEYMGYTSYMVFYAKDLKVYEPTVISKRLYPYLRQEDFQHQGLPAHPAASCREWPSSVGYC